MHQATRRKEASARWKSKEGALRETGSKRRVDGWGMVGMSQAGALSGRGGKRKMDIDEQGARARWIEGNGDQ